MPRDYSLFDFFRKKFPKAIDDDLKARPQTDDALRLLHCVLTRETLVELRFDQTKRLMISFKFEETTR